MFIEFLWWFLFSFFFFLFFRFLIVLLEVTNECSMYIYNVSFSTVSHKCFWGSGIFNCASRLRKQAYVLNTRKGPTIQFLGGLHMLLFFFSFCLQILQKKYQEGIIVIPFDQFSPASCLCLLESGHTFPPASVIQPFSSI